MSPDECLAAATHEIERTLVARPRVGIVLGTGLGRLVQSMAVTQTWPYAEIPHFPQATALGHVGRLVAGTLDEIPIVAMDGRFHRYEGYSRDTICFPVHVLHRLGIELLVLSNASGGLHPRLGVGDILAITDHLDFLGEARNQAPRNARAASPTPRLPRVPNPYDHRFVDAAQQVSRRCGWTLHEGVYAAMSGPCYETRAEYRLLRRLGADVVGMSTVPEAQAAARLQLPVLALSVVANACRPDRLDTTSGEEVLRAAAAAEPRVSAIVRGVVQASFAPRNTARTD